MNERIIYVQKILEKCIEENAEKGKIQISVRHTKRVGDKNFLVGKKEKIFFLFVLNSTHLIQFFRKLCKIG